jgi:hypothetical protein
MLCSLIVKGMVGLYPAVPFHRLIDFSKLVFGVLK